MQFCAVPISREVTSSVMATRWEVQLATVPVSYPVWPGTMLLGTKPSWVMAMVPVQTAAGCAGIRDAAVATPSTADAAASSSAGIRIRMMRRMTSPVR
jgi:hypothetical protein